MYIHKGQVFDVMDSSSDWWLARLVRDVPPHTRGFCEQGWVPGSFLEPYEGVLGAEEEAAIHAGESLERAVLRLGNARIMPGKGTGKELRTVTKSDANSILPCKVLKQSPYNGQTWL